jgi:hypothetical protein
LRPERQPTERQIEAVVHLGLGVPPADMTFAEASAILSARNAAREVLHEIGSTVHLHRAIRFQIEPYVVHFIMSDRRVLLGVMVPVRDPRDYSRRGERGLSR